MTFPSNNPFVPPAIINPDVRYIPFHLAVPSNVVDANEVPPGRFVMIGNYLFQMMEDIIPRQMHCSALLRGATNQYKKGDMVPIPLTKYPVVYVGGAAEARYLIALEKGETK